MKIALALGTAAILAASAFAPALARQDAQAGKTVEIKTVEMKPRALSRAQVQAMVARHFERLDADRDGVVTKAEAEAMRDRRMAHMEERMKARSAQSFDRLDADNDGSISRQEWESGAEKRIEKRIVIRERAAGGSAGSEAPAHGRAMRMMHGPGMPGMTGHMFELSDADGDGRVSLAEAQATAMRHFDMADTDRNGTVTPEEMRQMHRKMMNERRPG